MIGFKNGVDQWGSGIWIGGGGTTIIGGGESASWIMGTTSNPGTETMIVSNDNSVELWANCNNQNAEVIKKAVLNTNGNFSVNNGLLQSTLNSNTISIGSQNSGYCHISNSANIPFWFNHNILMENGKTIGSGNNYGPTAIEFTPVSGANHGGYLDFH